MMISSKNVPFALLAVSALALALAACSGGSSRLDAGQRISARGDAISGRGADWNAGQRNVQAGQKALPQSADSAAGGEGETIWADADYNAIRNQPSVLQPL